MSDFNAGLEDELIDPDCRDGKHGSCIGCICGCHDSYLDQIRKYNLPDAGNSGTH